MRTGPLARLAGLIALWLALVSADALTAQARDQPPAATTGTASIVGRVVVMIAGRAEPVRRARVTLHTDINGDTQATDADTDGRFKFDRLVAGGYWAIAEKAGFVPAVPDGRRTSDPPIPVELKAGQSLMLDLPMKIGAAVEGRVVDGHGDPLIGLPVRAIRVPDAPSQDSPGQDLPLEFRETHTDDLGRFRVHTLPAGKYIVEGSGTYFPGVLDKKDARVITVDAGQSVDMLDFMFGAEPFPNADAEPDVALPPPTPGGRIAGRVTRLDTGAPIAVAVVVLSSAQPGPTQNTRSDARGRFEFTGLAAGRYDLRVTAQGYVGLEGLAGRGASKVIDVKENAQIEKADVVLSRPSAIEGRVLDEFGDPAPGVQVQIAQVVATMGTTLLMPVAGGGAPVPTDDRGWFRVYGMFAGDYYALAVPSLFRGVAAARLAPEGAQGFAPTYFPGTDRPADAKPVHVTLGKDVADVTFALTPARMATLTGRLTNSAGQPVAKMPVSLVRSRGRDIREIMGVSNATDEEGIFSFRNVPPGGYLLQATSAEGFTSTSVTVPDIDDGSGATTVSLTLRPMISARGHISFEGSEPWPAKDKLTVLIQPDGITSAMMGGGVRTPSRLADDWTFEITQLALTGVIRVGVAAPWALKSVLLDGRDIADTPYDFQSADVNGLEIVLTTALGSVRGTVMDVANPATDVMVVVFPDDRTKWIFPSRFVAAARVGQQGAFTMPSLLPGRYLAVAVPTAALPYGGATPAWMAAVRPNAQALVVSAGASATVTLKVIK